MARVLTLAFCLLCLASPAAAEMCAMDIVPAATLLLPYFEVDLDDPGGLTTLLSISNATPEPVLAHMTLWTDWAMPSIDFDVFLTGYDVLTLDLGTIFHTGSLPVTADQQTDPSDTVSPHGDPAWDGSFSDCELFFPFSNPALNANLLDRIRSGHTGQAVSSLAGECLGASHGDNIARGFMTIDSVSRCNVFFPSHPDYFDDGGTGAANNDNVLFGDYLYFDPSTGAGSAQPMVHIEADSTFNAASTPTGYTFYGALLGGSGVDNREPLATAWAGRYFNGNNLETELIVWRDPLTERPPSNSFPCDTGPGWLPLTETQVVCFDEMETSVGVCPAAGGSSCFPLATQAVRADDLGIPFTAGWCWLNLNEACPDCVPGGFGTGGVLAQSHLSTRHTKGQVSGGLPMVELAHACEDLSEIFVSSLLFDDDFESGDTAAWSTVLP